MRFNDEWLELDLGWFVENVDEWLNAMKGRKYQSSTRKEHAQEAFDKVAEFARAQLEIQGLDPADYAAHPKYNALFELYKSKFGEVLTAGPSLNSVHRQWGHATHKRERLEGVVAYLNHLADPVASDNFLQGDADDVKQRLNQVYQNAILISNAGDNWQFKRSMFFGVATSTESETETGILSQSATRAASVEVGAREQGELTMEWRGKVKAKAGYEASAGARAAVSGGVSAENGQFTAEAETEFEIGIKLKANAEVATELIEAGGEVEAFAGAVANAQGTFSVGREGVAISASAEAFAGAKATAKGFFVLKWKGREIFKTEATGELTAGAGAKANFALEVPVQGASKFELGASATLGLGAGADTSVEVSMENIRMSGQEFLYTNVRQCYIQRIRRYQPDLMVNEQSCKRMHAKVLADAKSRLDVARMHEVEIQEKAKTLGRAHTIGESFRQAS